MAADEPPCAQDELASQQELEPYGLRWLVSATGKARVRTSGALIIWRIAGGHDELRHPR